MKLKNVFFIVIVGLMCFYVSGCGKEDVQIDLEKVREDILNLTEDRFDISYVADHVTDPNRELLFDAFVELYNFDLESMMNINIDHIEEMSAGKENDENRIEMYLVIQPVEGKKDILKNELDAYFSNLKLSISEENKVLLDKMVYEEYEGNLIYIISPNADKIMERIKESKPYIYGMLVDINDETLDSLLGINKDDVEEYSIGVPMITQASTYMIVKPKEGKKSVVKEALDTYLSKQEEQWKTYLPDQYEIIKNRTYKEIGDYLIYVASSDNDKVIQAIENNKIEHK